MWFRLPAPRQDALPTARGLAALALLVQALWLPAAGAQAAGGEPELVGSVEGDTYRGPGGAFSVTVPYAADTPERSSMKIKEQASSAIQAVAFNQATPGLASFRMEVTRLPGKGREGQTFRDAARQTFQWYARRLAHVYGTRLQRLYEQNLEVNGRRTVHTLYKQPADSGASENSRGVRYHAFYLSDYGSHVVLFWTEFLLPELTIEAEEEIINQRWPAMQQARRFVSSFRLH